MQCIVQEKLLAKESSEKLTRALKHNLQTYQDPVFVTCDTKYYKRRDSKKRKGPGKVISVNDWQVLIKHGSTYARYHPLHIILTDTTDKGVHENRTPWSNLKEKKTMFWIRHMRIVVTAVTTTLVTTVIAMKKIFPLNKLMIKIYRIIDWILNICWWLVSCWSSYTEIIIKSWKPNYSTW